MTRKELTTPFESPRMFQVWSYTVSHGQLLFRSTKSDDSPTRIDILFKNVDAMNVARRFDGLSIRDATAEERLSAARGSDVELDDPNQRLWIVESLGFRGHVAAGVVLVHEADAEYDEPSALLPY